MWHAFKYIHLRVNKNMYIMYILVCGIFYRHIRPACDLVGGVGGLRGRPKCHCRHTWVRRCHSLTTLCHLGGEISDKKKLACNACKVTRYRHQNEPNSWRQKKETLSTSHLFRFFGQRKIYWEQCIALPVARWRYIHPRNDLKYYL